MTLLEIAIVVHSGKGHWHSLLHLLFTYWSY